MSASGKENKIQEESGAEAIAKSEPGAEAEAKSEPETEAKSEPESGAETEAKSNSAAGSFRLLKHAVFAALFVLYVFYLLHVFSARPADSDYANLILKADDMLHGNPFLRGWYNTSNDIVFFLISTAIFGVDHMSYILGCVLMFLTVVFITWLFIIRHVSPKNRTVCSFLFLLTAAFPSPGFVYAARCHLQCFALFLLSLMMFENWQKKGRKKYLILGIFVLGFAGAGDMLIFLTGFLPLFLVLAIRLYRQAIRGEAPGRRALAILAGVVLSAVLASSMDRIFYMVGGAEKTPFIMEQGFSTLKNIPHLLKIYVTSIMWLFDCDYTLNRLVDPAALFTLVRLIVAWGALILALVHVLGFFLRKRRGDVQTVFSLSVILMSCAFVTTSVVIDMQNARYLSYFPFAFAVILLPALDGYINRHVISVEAKKIFIPVLSVLLILFSLWGAKKAMVGGDVFDADRYNLMLRLEENDLHSGYAMYWDAGITTLYSKGDVHLRAIVSAESKETGEEALTMYKWFCKKSWYDEYADFVVLNTKDKRDFFSRQQVIDHFGEPVKELEVGVHRVLCYDRDISKELARDVIVGEKQ